MEPRDALRLLSTARSLADTGQYAGLVALLGNDAEAELQRSPTLALLYGIAHVRLGFPETGRRWALHALKLAQERADPGVEARALNVVGAIDLATGRVADAEKYLTGALAEADRIGDHATVGRCCNNLGIIANLRGRHDWAIGSHTMAIAAFQRAGVQRGVAEATHNLGIAYKDLDKLAMALETSDQAVQRAEAAGDRGLTAVALAGRADIQRLAGFAAGAHREVQTALRIHREMGDVLGEAEDLRILAGALAALGDVEAAEAMYRGVITVADRHADPLLAAHTERDLVRLLVGQDRAAEAHEFARRARARFESLGAEAEVRRLDAGLVVGREGAGSGTRGVTLIELLIVIVMIGVLAAIALPKIDVNRYRMDSAMQAVGSTLLVAQRLAVTRQYDVVVTIDVAGKRLLVHEDANNNGVVDAGERVRVVPLEDYVAFGRGGAPPLAILGPGDPVTFNKRVAGRPVVVFHRNGSASEAGGFYLTSRRPAGSERPGDGRAVDIERGTGRVAWYRYAGGTWTRGF